MPAASKSPLNTPQLGAREVFERVREAWGESPFYQAGLRGPAPDRLYFQPIDPFTPDKEVAEAFARGKIALGEETLDCEGDISAVWEHGSGDGPVCAFLQEFSWLRHLEALGDEGKSAARSLVQAWLERFEKWSAMAWDPYFTAERLVQMTCHAPLLLADADPLWRSRVLTAMARQTRHLARAAHRAPTGFDRLMTALGLTVAGYCLPGCEAPAERGLEMTRRELRLQLRPDGGHVSRNPSRQLMLAVRLQMAASALEGRGFPPPGFLRHALMRVNALASFFRCADGRLAVFNGGYEDDPRAVLSVQKAISGDAIPTEFARHSGYHRISAGRALLIVDTITDTAKSAFESAGSLHFSSGRSRIFANCGNGGHRAAAWRDALRARAAHCALSLETKSGGDIAFGDMSHKRAEDAKGQLLEVERQLFTKDGAEGVYRRRLYLGVSGADLRGEELVVGNAAQSLEEAIWRFHLHPSVRASLARDRRSVILLLPNKEGWRFKSSCEPLELERSVYCGAGGMPISTEQIVVRAAPSAADGQHAAAAKWALRRLDPV
ncbi:MAG: heparinase II/III family protein [Pseudomonadota bacterium]